MSDFGMAGISGATMEQIREQMLRKNAGKVALHTYSRDSFPLDLDPYRDDEWATEIMRPSTVRQLAEPIWRDYCIRHRMEWPFYRVELLDGTPLDLDQPIPDEVGDEAWNGVRYLWVRFRRLESVA